VGYYGSRFAVRSLFSWGETALTTVEQMNRWLCQPAVIPITAICGETQEYLLSNVIRTVHVRVRNCSALLTHVQSTFDTLVIVCVTRAVHPDAVGYFRAIIEILDIEYEPEVTQCPVCGRVGLPEHSHNHDC
jgi:hypothetical protein